jgi:uncharacterized repeat protein (TIGR01451 family)
MLLRILLLLAVVSPLLTSAHPITPYLEMVKVGAVSNAWKTLALSNTYSNPVVACTYNLPSSASNEGAVRVQIVGTAIQVKVQLPLNSTAVTASDVYCTISEAGSYTVPIKYEAHTVSSTQTNKKSLWQSSRMVNVTGNKVQNYTKPVVIGQVMSYNNPNFVTFWSNNCNRTTSATNASICVGKHTAESNISSPTTETLGYFIAEEAEYFLASSNVKIALGVDIIRGVHNGPPFIHNFSNSYSLATATQSAMDGGDGGWAVLYGANPISNQIHLAIDEDTVVDSERGHTTEQVAYWVMEPITKTNADLRLNEVLYRQGSGIREFIELSVLSAGSIVNYVVSSQDGTSQNYRLPDVDVNVGDYVILHSNIGTPNSAGGVHHVYTNSASTALRDAGDDIVVLKPSDTDATALAGSGQVNAIPVDYMSYGTGGDDPVPVSINGVTVTWNVVDKTRLAGVLAGQSISLTPNVTDSDTSVCWEKTTSGDASACASFVITRDTDTSSFINSLGQSNTSAPELNLAKSIATIYDPFNGASNPKAIPGSVLEYSITAKNSGNLAADINTIKISDLVPPNTKLCVSDTAHCKAPYFVNGTPSSGLSLASVVYSDDSGVSYVYSASADAEGADSNATNLRVLMDGAFQAQTGATATNFQLKLRVIVE